MYEIIPATNQINNQQQTRIWAKGQRGGRTAEYRWCPLLNAAKFGWCPIQDIRHSRTLNLTLHQSQGLGTLGLHTKHQPTAEKLSPLADYCRNFTSLQSHSSQRQDWMQLSQQVTSHGQLLQLHHMEYCITVKECWQWCSGLHNWLTFQRDSRQLCRQQSRQCK